VKKLCLLALLLTGCLTIDSVTQPSSVAGGESFSITVEGTHDYTTYSGTTVWLGMMLPNGVEVDSVRYKAGYGAEGVLTEPDSAMSDWLQQARPPDDHMYWTVFAVTPPDAESSGGFKAQAYLFASDSTSPGQYLVDYYVGYSYLSWTVDDSVLDQPMEVTALGAAERRGGSGVRTARVWPSLFRGQLRICVPEPDDVRILDTSGRLVRSLRLGQTGYWDGRDGCGRRVPAGAYLVRGRYVSSAVTLVD